MPNAQVVPNFFTYAAAISACEKDGQWQLALSFFNAMRRAKMSLIKFDEAP
jgi:pentatricopeptide repeat protein